MEKYAVYTTKLLPKAENFARDTVPCVGCGEALAVRLAFKALGNQCGCRQRYRLHEIVSSPFHSRPGAFPGFTRCSKIRRLSLRVSKPDSRCSKRKAQLRTKILLWWLCWRRRHQVTLDYRLSRAHWNAAMILCYLLR